MRPLFRIAVLSMVVLISISATAESAKSLYNQGRKAEARQDYMAAFEAYRKAYEEKPEELRYRIAFQRTRFLASAGHVNKGQDLREVGKLSEALAEFVYAAKIDPSNYIAQQELNRTKAMIEGAPAGQPESAPAPKSSISKRLDEAVGPVELTPVSPQPITLKIANDSKLVYETIGKLAGINVLFDPDYTSRRITLELNGVSLREGLDIVAFQSKTFWRPVTSNTIFIAQDSPSKRKELEQSVLKTFYLSNATAPSDLQDAQNTLRTILEIQKVTAINSQSAIIVRGTPDQIALAEKILGDIDKAKPEVIVEVAIMQVRRDKLRNLGIQPPASVSGAIVPNTGAVTTTTGGTTTGTASTPNITLNTLANITDKDISLTIPGATVNFLMSDSSTKLIQNPQIRASDGLKASLKIGDRVPIATGQLGGFAGTAAGGGIVNTQFQYIDVGVNIDITPHVFTGREVGLKLSLDVSSVTGSSNIGGITQPIISQRKIEHDIRLKEGEVNLIGGIFEDQDTKSISGIPGLAQLPFLKYLFGQERKERVENEIIFVLIPHIVRGQELTEMNQRAIDVGTGTTLDIRRESRPAQASPIMPAPQAPVPQTQAPTAPPKNGEPPAAIEQPSAASVPTPPTMPVGQPLVRFDPPQIVQPVGTTFNVNVVVKGAQDIYSAPLQISYDPAMLQMINISNGDMLSRDGQAIALVHREEPERGMIQANATRPPGAAGVSGDGVLYVLTFQAKAPGNSMLNIIRPSLRNSAQQSIPMMTTPTTVNIQ